MTTTLKAPPAGGAFLLGPTDPADVFTPERFTPEQLAARDAIATFVAREAVPRAERIAAKDFEATRELLATGGATATSASTCRRPTAALAWTTRPRSSSPTPCRRRSTSR